MYPDSHERFINIQYIISFIAEKKMFIFDILKTLLDTFKDISNKENKENLYLIKMLVIKKRKPIYWTSLFHRVPREVN